MDEFKKQLQNNLRKDINEFNSRPEFAEIRQLYKQHFDRINSFIKKAGHKLAIEDIANIDKKLARTITDNIQLLKEINRAIDLQELTLKDIK